MAQPVSVSLNKPIALIKARVMHIGPWTSLALLLAVVVLGYYALMGYQYWTARQTINASTGKIAELRALMRGPAPKEAELTSQSQAQQTQLDALKSSFTYTTTDQFIDTFSAISRSYALKLTSVSMGKTLPKGFDSVTYTVQPVSMTMEGSTTNIFNFIEALHRTATVINISSLSVSLSERGDTTAAQLQFNIYLSPEYAPKPTPTPTPTPEGGG